MNRNLIVAGIALFALVAVVICFRLSESGTASMSDRNHYADHDAKTKEETSTLPRMEFTFNLNQSLNDNSNQGSTAEYGAPVQSQGPLLIAVFLALLDIVIIFILLRYILIKRNQ